MVAKAVYSCLVLALVRLIFLTSFLLLIGCNESIPQTSRNPSPAVVTRAEVPGLVAPEQYPLLLNRLKQLAGDGAINCGIVGIWDKPEATSNCALEARQDNKPFFVRYSVQGIDTEQVLGYAGDAAGNVSSVWYYGRGYGNGGPPSDPVQSRNLKVTDDGRISIESCSKPVNFRRANNGRVTCFARDP